MLQTSSGLGPLPAFCILSLLLSDFFSSPVAAPLPWPIHNASFEKHFAQVVETTEETTEGLRGFGFSKQIQRGSWRRAQRWQIAGSMQGRGGLARAGLVFFGRA
jgi:hypothetical protein